MTLPKCIAKVSNGEITVELLDDGGIMISPFNISYQNCMLARATTISAVRNMLEAAVLANKTDKKSSGPSI